VTAKQSAVKKCVMKLSADERERLRALILSRGEKDRARAGQSQHPQAGFTLRGIPSCRSPPTRRAVRVA
jgi:hypothetical protein